MTQRGKLPSVTEILEAVNLGPDFSMVKPGVLAAAMDRGHGVHAAIEAHHYGFLDRGAIPEAIKGYVAAYERFLAESGHEPIASELEVVHDGYGYCGHPDRIGWLAKVRMVFDWKTTESLDLKPVARQLAGYKLAWNHQRPDAPVAGCATVQFKRNATYRVHEINVHLADDSGFTPEEQFLAAFVVYRAKAQ